MPAGCQLGSVRKRFDLRLPGAISLIQARRSEEATWGQMGRGSVGWLSRSRCVRRRVPGRCRPPWQASVPFTNEVVSRAGGRRRLPRPAGPDHPDPGTCSPGSDSNFSWSWIAVEPGTENLVGTSKFFFETFSTFYDFHLGSFTIEGGSRCGRKQPGAGLPLTTAGTPAMPPSWTNNTIPNVDFDTKGRAYEVTLPFNAFWANLHRNSNIGHLLQRRPRPHLGQGQRRPAA